MNIDQALFCWCTLFTRLIVLIFYSIKRYSIQLDGGSSTPVFGAGNEVQIVLDHRRLTKNLAECLYFFVLLADEAQLFATGGVEIL